MANRYAYIDPYGVQKEVIAETPEEALANIAPSDISDAHSGVMYLGTAGSTGEQPQGTYSPQEIEDMRESGDTTSLSDEDYWNTGNTGFSDTISYYDENTGEWAERPMTPEEIAQKENAMTEERGIQEYEATLPSYRGGGGGLSAEALAAERAKAFKSTQAATTNPYTSYSFNKEAMAGANRAWDNLNLKLKDIVNTTWDSNGTKEEQTKGLYEVTANEIAKLFKSEEDFRREYTFNPTFKQTIDRLTTSGVSQESITSRITAPVTYRDLPAEQSVNEYLANGLSKDATQEQIDAYNDLFAEKELSQQQISYLANISKEYKDAYFGTPEQTGIIEERRIQAEEAKKIIEQKAIKEQENASAQAKLVKERNDADVAIELATIEENRLKAKNYMTGVLAKMGALNTTGAAPQALATLEAKYQTAASKMRSDLKFANAEIDIKLNNTVNDIEIARDEKINEISSDLTKEKEDIIKEIMKIEQSSNKEIYNISLSFAKEYRNLVDKYSQRSKADAEKYAKEFAAIATKKNKELEASTPEEGLMEGQYSAKQKGILMPDGSIKPYNLTPTMAQEVADAGLIGEDTIKFFKATESTFRDWFIMNNTRGEVSYRILKDAYDAWKKETAKKPKATGSEADVEDMLNF